jgi:hypothetical protein
MKILRDKTINNITIILKTTNHIKERTTQILNIPKLLHQDKQEKEHTISQSKK